MDGTSFLAITNLLMAPIGVYVRWHGGVQATQYLERSDILGTTLWQVIFTNLPPTSESGSFTDALGTNLMRFYRIKATR